MAAQTAASNVSGPIDRVWVLKADDKPLTNCWARQTSDLPSFAPIMVSLLAYSSTDSPMRCVVFVKVVSSNQLRPLWQIASLGHSESLEVADQSRFLRHHQLIT